jgi:iron complex outermembrane recepter protein
MKKITYLLSIFSFLLFSSLLSAQVKISGEIKNVLGNTLEGVNITLQPSNKYGITNGEGYFEIANVPSGNYQITISYLGYKTITDNLQVSNTDLKSVYTLEEDLLSLGTVVVTGTFDPRKKLESSTSVSTISAKNMEKIFPRGTTNILQNIPGTFTDASAGEVFTKVYTRGISAAAEDDMGWYYVSLQEDGLPVSLAQHSYYSPDLFFRYDTTIDKLEAIRGGSSSITAMNAPGGIYNFISKGVRREFGGDVSLQSGIQGDGNAFYRGDISVGSPLGNNWFLNAGGHYRHDDGARNTNFVFSKGGQFKFNLTKEFDNGYLKFYGKVLNDKTNRWNGVAATNWNDPTPAFGQDFRNTSLLMPAFNGSIPDGRNLEGNATNSFDPSQGVYAKDLAFGVDFFNDLGNNWSIRNNMKFSSKNANWQTSISNVFVSLDNPLAYFITGAGFPIGEVAFYDARSGSELARIDNSPILGGGPSQYLTAGRLPNDAIMGTSAWYKENEADEFMQQLTLRKKWTNHDLNFGFASGFSNTSLFTQGSFAFVTYEPNPRMLRVTLENPGNPVVALSDSNGVSNYGGLFYVNANAKISQLAGFVNDLWKLSDKVNLDLGLRLETIKHNGTKDRFAPFSQPGGIDGDDSTDYDNGVLASTGDQDIFNYNYNYASFSAGINYKISEEAALFGRVSKGNKAPELNYYFNNFSNVPINGKGEVQKINQVELGLKSNLKNFSFTTTLFWSQLKNIGVSNFEFDPDNGSIFYTPIQFNASETIGLEWESVYSPIQNLRFLFNGTLQNAKAKDWTIYNAAGSVDTSDDSIQDYSGNALPFNPTLMFNLGTEYELNKFLFFLKWQYMGEREGNVANAFQLPAYSLFDLGVGYNISKNLSANLLVTNLFNSEGLANFFGDNSFGANANSATQDYIQANPDASFVVVPVLPRGTILKLNYSF